MTALPPYLINIALALKYLLKTYFLFQIFYPTSPDHYAVEKNNSPVMTKC